MKTLASLLAIALLAGAAVPGASAQPSPAAPAAKSADPSAVKAKIKEMEDAWSKALMDKDRGVAAVGAMVAADYAGMSSKGVMQDKAKLLANLAAETDVLTSAVNDKVDVQLYGANVAVACGTSTEKGKDKDGKEFTHLYAWVDTWMERNGKWECIGSGGLMLPEKK